MSHARILVVDDCATLAEQVCATLSGMGHEADRAADGEAGLRHVLRNAYDLVVLDIQMPGLDGWSVLEGMRRNDVNTPVMMLTSLRDLEDRVRALELGADDYMTKPFDFREFTLKVQAVLRRSTTAGDRLKAADVELRPGEWRAFRDGRALHLSPSEFRLLLLLVQREGKPVTREEISEQVLGTTLSHESNPVDVLVRRLRKKVDDRFPVARVTTVRGVGYAFDAG